MPFGSRQEDFIRFSPYISRVAILVMWSGPVERTFIPPCKEGSTWNLASIGPVVSEEKMFENVDIHTHGRQRPSYTMSSPVSLRLRWAKLKFFPNIRVSQIYSCHNKQMSHDMTKPKKWVCAQRRLRSAWASAKSDQSLRCPHEESLGP